MSIQEALRLLRMELGMTQSDLAEKLNKAFVTVNRWENGKGFPSRNNAKEILDVAKRYNASDECIAYLYKVLLPSSKRSTSALAYGFPEIDRDFLFQLADGSANSIYAIEEETYNLLYANRTAKESADCFKAVTIPDYESEELLNHEKKKCYEFFAGRTAPCPFCPMEELKKEASRDFSIGIPGTNKKFKIHARPGEINGKKVIAIYLTDVTQEDAERNALYKLTNDIPDGVGIYSVYKDGRVELEFMNTTYFKMIGEERHESLFKDELYGFNLVHPDDVGGLLNIIRKTYLKNNDVETTVRMSLGDKTYHRIKITAKIIKRDEQKLTYYCLFHDIDK